MSEATVRSPFKDPLSESIYQTIRTMGACVSRPETATLEAQLERLTRQAFESLDYDFVAEILTELEKDSEDFAEIFNWAQFFDASATMVVDKRWHHQLILIPFLASSSYGLPYGKLPESVLDLLNRELSDALPQGYQLRINTDILSAEYFATTPTAMHRWIEMMVAQSEPGVSTFIESDETAEEVNNLVADIRLIALIVSAPNTPNVTRLDHDYEATTALQQRLGSQLRALLRENYLATRIDLVMDHGVLLDEYLAQVAGDEVYTEALWMAPPFILVEAGKLFRHFALKEAVANLKQSFDLQPKDLQAAVGAFFESPSVGCLSLTEYRVGISKKGDDQTVLQGVSWPIFNTDHVECQKVLERTLLVCGFDENNMKPIHAVFPIEDDDDEMFFPTYSGELSEPQAPELETTTPSPYTLN